MKNLRFKLIQLGISISLFVLIAGFQNCAKVNFASSASKTTDSNVVPQGSPDPSPSPVASPSPNPSPVASPSPAPSPAASPSPSPSPVASPSPAPSPNPSPAASPSPSPSPCKTVLENYDKNLRIIFMVDDSGSTFDSVRNGVTTKGTDPQFVYRKDSIQNFLNTYGAKTNFTYTFARFSDSADVYLQSSNTFSKADVCNTAKFGTASDATNALTLYAGAKSTNNPHGGGTNYTSAFNCVNSIITNDVPPAGIETDYAVLFMSDGQPNPTLLSDFMQTVIDPIAGFKLPTSINTIYFGPTVAQDATAQNAINVLTSISNEGKGQFLDTNNMSTGTIDIQSVIQVPKIVCTQ